MRVMIIGADGQLGSELCKIIPKGEQVPLTINDLDITNRKKVAAIVSCDRPDIVINTSGYHRVDDCEDHEAQAFAVNTVGVKYLAESCRAVNAVLVHFSTDYVFKGDKKAPYVETDMPRPQSVYGISKLAGEYCVKYLLDRYFIIRTTGLYGSAGCLGKGGGNFVEKMIQRADQQVEIKVVVDEIISPTYTVDLAQKISELIKTSHYGLYHIVNQGACSWYEFAIKIFELLGQRPKIIPVASKDYKTKAKRPAYSVLKNEALLKIGLTDLRPWPEALEAYLKEKGYLLS